MLIKNKNKKEKNQIFINEIEDIAMEEIKAERKFAVKFILISALFLIAFGIIVNI